MLSVQSTIKHQTRIGSCSPVNSADTMHKSAGWFNPEEPARLTNQPEATEAARSCRDLMKSSLVSYKWSSAMQRKANQRNIRRTNTCVSSVKAMLQLPLSVGSYLLSSKHHVSLHVSAIAKYPFTCVCFSKTFFHLCAPAKHLWTQPTFQRNQKFPLPIPSSGVCRHKTRPWYTGENIHIR